LKIKYWLYNNLNWYLYIIGICLFGFGVYHANQIYPQKLSLIILSIGIVIGIVMTAGGILKKSDDKRFIFIVLILFVIFFYFMVEKWLFDINGNTVSLKSYDISIELGVVLNMICIVIIVGIITLFGSRLLVFKEKIEYNRSLMKLIELHKINPDKALKIIDRMSETASREGYQISMKLSKITKKVTSSLKKNSNKK
jgi:hypothetical protein